MQGRLLASKRNADSCPSVLQADEKNNKIPVATQGIGAGGSYIDITHRYVFFAEEFDRIMTKYEHVSLTDRINSIIMNHSIPEADARIFYIYWTDADKHLYPLKISLTSSDKFASNYSRYLTEKNLAELVPGFLVASFKEKQKYVSLKVEQVVGQDSANQSLAGKSKKIKLAHQEFSDIPLLAMWVTMDGFIGELRAMQPGVAMSASELMSLYQYFSKLFTADNIFVFDDVVLDDSIASVPVPLRLISALATGKTWYEQSMPDLKLMDCRRFSVTYNDTITQSQVARERSLSELQMLPLEKWHEMLDVNRQPVLSSLYRIFFPKMRTSNRFFRASQLDVEQSSLFGTTTVADLAAAVYADARSKDDISTPLRELNELLCGNLKYAFGSIPLQRSDSDYWVKSRVHQLLWGSCLWKVTKSHPDSLRHSRI